MQQINYFETLYQITLMNLNIFIITFLLLKQKDSVLKNIIPLQILIFCLDMMPYESRFRLSMIKNIDFFIHYWALDSSCYLKIFIPHLPPIVH